MIRITKQERTPEDELREAMKEFQKHQAAEALRLHRTNMRIPARCESTHAPDFHFLRRQETGFTNL